MAQQQRLHPLTEGAGQASHGQANATRQDEVHDVALVHVCGRQGEACG